MLIFNYLPDLFPRLFFTLNFPGVLYLRDTLSPKRVLTRYRTAYVPHHSSRSDVTPPALASEPAVRTSTPLPIEQSQLPNFISQFEGLKWFDKLFPNTNPSVSFTKYYLYAKRIADAIQYLPVLHLNFHINVNIVIIHFYITVRFHDNIDFINLLLQQQYSFQMTMNTEACSLEFKFRVSIKI